jgi:hypothetical protein
MVNKLAMEIWAPTLGVKEKILLEICHCKIKMEQAETQKVSLILLYLLTLYYSWKYDWHVTSARRHPQKIKLNRQQSDASQESNGWFRRSRR